MVKGPMSPESATKPRNTAGASIPRVGCCQREGFSPGDPSACEVEDRLVVQDDLSSADGVSEAFHELEPLTGVLVVR
jgi:hypothetical protein